MGPRGARVNGGRPQCSRSPFVKPTDPPTGRSQPRPQPPIEVETTQTTCSHDTRGPGRGQAMVKPHAVGKTTRSFTLSRGRHRGRLGDGDVDDAPGGRRRPGDDGGDVLVL